MDQMLFLAKANNIGSQQILIRTQLRDAEVTRSSFAGPQLQIRNLFF